MQILHPAMIGLLSGEHYLINYPSTLTDVPHECEFMSMQHLIGTIILTVVALHPLEKHRT